MKYYKFTDCVYILSFIILSCEFSLPSHSEVNTSYTYAEIFVYDAFEHYLDRIAKSECDNTQIEKSICINKSRNAHKADVIETKYIYDLVISCHADKDISSCVLRVKDLRSHGEKEVVKYYRVDISNNSNIFNKFLDYNYDYGIVLIDNKINSVENIYLQLSDAYINDLASVFSEVRNASTIINSENHNIQIIKYLSTQLSNNFGLSKDEAVMINVNNFCTIGYSYTNNLIMRNNLDNYCGKARKKPQLEINNYGQFVLASSAKNCKHRRKILLAQRNKIVKKLLTDEFNVKCAAEVS